MVSDAADAVLGFPTLYRRWWRRHVPNGVDYDERFHHASILSGGRSACRGSRTSTRGIVVTVVRILYALHVIVGTLLYGPEENVVKII
jgi:hypothetical protein